MKTIKLSRGGTCVISEEDYETVSKYKWWLDTTGYISGFVNKKIVRLHRFLMQPAKGLCVDHINLNKTDNTRTNLRVCSYIENNRNIVSKKTNKSGYKGVSPYYGSKWRSTIGVNKKQIHLGTFTSKEDAARAYNQAALKLFGEFANLNKL